MGMHVPQPRKGADEMLEPVKGQILFIRYQVGMIDDAFINALAVRRFRLTRWASALSAGSSAF
jgi:hypothetical protein